MLSSSTNVLIGFTQELKAEKALTALNALELPMAKVKRNKKWETIEAAQLVPGDIVELEEGDAVPTDLRYDLQLLPLF